MNSIKREMFIFVLLLLMSMFYLPAAITGLFGLLFVIYVAAISGVKGGIFSSLMASLVILSLFFLFELDFGFDGLVASISSYLLVGLGLGQRVDSMRRQRDRLDSILEGTHVGTWEWNVETGEMVFNERWASILGFTLEDLSPLSIETWRRSIHPEDYRVGRDLLERHFEGELEHYSLECRMRHREGEWVWVLVRGRVTRWSRDGDPLWMYGTMLSMDVQKRREEELRRKKRSLSLAQTFAKVGFWEYDMRRKSLFWSKECEALFGLEEGEFEGTYEAFLGYIHPEDREYVEEMNAPIVENEEGKPLEYEHRILREDGEVRWMRESAGVVLDEDGEPSSLFGFIMDITDQKKVERSLLESRENLSITLDSIGDGVITTDSKGCVLRMNPVAQRLTGWSLEESKGLPLTDIFHIVNAKTFEPVENPVGRVLKEGEILGLANHTMLIAKDGSRYQIADSAAPISSEGGDITGVVLVFRDVTKEYMMRRSLEESEERFQKMLALVPDMISIHDPEMNILYSNWQGFGAVPRERRVLHSKCYRTYRGRDSICPDCQAKSVFLTKEPFQEEIELPEGRWVDLRVIPILDEDQEVEMFVEWVRDITKQKALESALKEKEERYRSIVDQTMEMVYLHTIEGSLLEVNRAACTYTGYRRDELLGMNVSDLHPGGDDEEHSERVRIWREWRVGQKVSIETQHQRRDGSLFPVEVSAGKALIGGEEYILGIVRDITDRRQTERKLAAYTKEIEDLYHTLHEEMNKARNIHEHILPSTLPHVEGISFDAHYQPAERMGGDFYDVIRVGDKLVIYLSDVSGHSLDSAMLSFFVKHTIKGFLSLSSLESLTPENILAHLAEEFQQTNYPQEYFICIFMGVLDLETMEFVYSGAGFQDTPLVSMGNGERLALKSRGLFITSIFSLDKLSLEERRIELTPGTTIFFNTDGLTEEGEPGAFYGDRLSEVFYEREYLPPDRISQAVVEDFRDFNHGSLQGRDDITFLVMQVEPERREEHIFRLRSDFEEVKRLREEVLEVFGGSEEVYPLLTCLNELLFNAIEHGNGLELERVVLVEILVMDGYIEVTVEDEGEGFDWGRAMERSLDLEGSSERGRGIAMVQVFSDALYYNERGNRATFYLERERE